LGTLAKPVAQLDRAIGQPNPYFLDHPVKPDDDPGELPPFNYCPVTPLGMLADVGQPNPYYLDHPVKPDDDLEKLPDDDPQIPLPLP